MVIILKLKIELNVEFSIIVWASGESKNIGGKTSSNIGKGCNLSECAINRMLNPVCGGDGETYINLDQLECAKELCKPS